MTDISLPWTYVYRYPDGALRMSGGREINGSKPVEAIGVYLAPTFEAAEARVRELEKLLARILALGQSGGWRRMPDGRSFSSTPLAGDIAAAIRKPAQEVKHEAE